MSLPRVLRLCGPQFGNPCTKMYLAKSLSGLNIQLVMTAATGIGLYTTSEHGLWSWPASATLQLYELRKIALSCLCLSFLACDVRKMKCLPLRDIVNIQ